MVVAQPLVDSTPSVHQLAAVHHANPSGLRRALQRQASQTLRLSQTVWFIGGNEGSTGYLYAFNALGCKSTSCSPIWTYPLGISCAILSAPTVATIHGTPIVYVGDGCATFFALNAKTGSLIWQANLKGSVTGIENSSAAVANGVVYVGNGDGSLYAFNACGWGWP